MRAFLARSWGYELVLILTCKNYSACGLKVPPKRSHDAGLAKVVVISEDQLYRFVVGTCHSPLALMKFAIHLGVKVRGYQGSVPPSRLSPSLKHLYHLLRRRLGFPYQAKSFGCNPTGPDTLADLWRAAGFPLEMPRREDSLADAQKELADRHSRCQIYQPALCSRGQKCAIPKRHAFSTYATAPC